MRLFHYTCDDGLRGILRDGFVRPNYHPVLGVEVAWFTDLDEPIRDALGLTSFSLGCDRTAHRFEVIDERGCVPWTAFARSLPRGIREVLEDAPGTRPRHWWLSRTPITAVLNERAAAWTTTA